MVEAYSMAGVLTQPYDSENALFSGFVKFNIYQLPASIHPLENKDYTNRNVKEVRCSATSYSQTGIFYKRLSHGSSQVEDADINRVQELEQHSLRSAQHISVSARLMAECGQLDETQQSLVFHTLQLSFLFLFNKWPSMWRKGEYLCDPPHRTEVKVGSQALG